MKLFTTLLLICSALIWRINAQAPAAAAASGDVKICIWDRFKPYIDPMINYMRNNYGINVSIVSSEDYTKYLSTKSLYGCDLVLIDPFSQFDEDKEGGLIHAIDDYVGNTVQERINDQVDGELYADLMEDIKSYNGKILGLPFLLDYGVLFYNAGLLNGNVPTTWEELLNVSVNDILKTVYIGQFNEEREYYYNFVENVANFGDEDDFSLYGEQAKDAVNNFREMFEKEIIDEKAWNQNVELSKKSFCDGNAIFMRSWSSINKFLKNQYNDTTLNCNSFNEFVMTTLPKSSKRSKEQLTLLKGLYFVVSTNVREERLPQVVDVLEKITSKNAFESLIDDQYFNDVTPYKSLLESNKPYCSPERVNCGFYLQISDKLLTRSIGRFNREGFKGINQASFEVVKKYYKKDKDADNYPDELKNFYSDRYVEWTDMSAIAFTAISIIGIVVTIVVLIVVIKNRTSLVIRRSSPLFLYIMLAGIIIAFGSVLTFIGKPSDIICKIRPVIIVLAFGLSFLALFIKTFRIKVIFDKSDIKVQDKYLLMYSGIIMGIELVIVGLWTYIAPMTPKVRFISDKMHYYSCTTEDNTLGFYFQLVLVTLNALILLYGCYLAIKVKDVYSDYNESKVIGLSIYGIMICMVIQIIISACVALGHSVIFVIQSLMIILSAVILLTFMFIPKFWKLHMTGTSNDPSSNNKSSSQRLPSNNQNNSYSVKSEKNGYINMQNVDEYYKNNQQQLGQRSNNYYGGQMNNSSENLTGNSGGNSSYYNNNSYAYHNKQIPDAYMQYNNY